MAESTQPCWCIAATIPAGLVELVPAPAKCWLDNASCSGQLWQTVRASLGVVLAPLNKEVHYEFYERSFH